MVGGQSPARVARYGVLSDGRELRLRTAGRVLPEMQVKLYDEQGNDVTAGGGPAIPACKGATTRTSMPVSLSAPRSEAARRERVFSDGAWATMSSLLDMGGVLPRNASSCSRNS